MHTTPGANPEACVFGENIGERSEAILFILAETHPQVLRRRLRGLSTVADRVAFYRACRFLRPGAITPLPEDTLQ